MDGQSAGAMAIHDLIASPLAAGLFKRAIIESGLPNNAPPVSLAQAEYAGAALAHSKNAASLAALRALPPQELIGSLQSGPRFAPIVDGVLLPAAPGKLAAQGKFNDTPVLIGMVADENSALGPKYGAAGSAGISPCSAELARAESILQDDCNHCAE